MRNRFEAERERERDGEGREKETHDGHEKQIGK